MSEDCFPFFQAMQGDSASGLNLDLQVSHIKTTLLFCELALISFSFFPLRQAMLTSKALLSRSRAGAL